LVRINTIEKLKEGFKFAFLGRSNYPENDIRQHRQNSKIFKVIGFFLFLVSAFKFYQARSFFTPEGVAGSLALIFTTLALLEGVDCENRALRIKIEQLEES